MSVLRVGTGAGAERARDVGKLLPGRGRGAVGARQICWERSIELALFELQRTYYQAGIDFGFSWHESGSLSILIESRDYLH